MGMLLRVVWFLAIGWWLGPLWLGVSIGLMLTIIGFPVGAYTATKTWHVATFKRKPQTVIVEAKEQQS